jgi:hypothetical protein
MGPLQQPGGGWQRPAGMADASHTYDSLGQPTPRMAERLANHLQPSRKGAVVTSADSAGILSLYSIVLAALFSQMYSRCVFDQEI